MATCISTTSGASIIYTITDVRGNTGTVTAPPVPQPVSFSSTTGLLADGLKLLTTLMQMLSTDLRPKSLAGQPASFTN